MLSQITAKSLGVWTRLNKASTTALTVSSATRMQREPSYDLTPTSRTELMLTQGKLENIARLFTIYSTKGQRGLNLQMFRKVMQKYSHLSDQEIHVLFMKVDTNCNGLIDWEEFMAYYIQECIEKEQMHKSELLTFPSSAQTFRTDHRDSIVRLLLLPAYLHGHIDPTRGRYITIGRAGVISFWTVEFRHRYSRQVKSINRNRVWVTDAVSFQRYHLMVVCTTNEDIQFFNTNASRFERICRVVKLPACPLRICCLEENNSDREESALFWGDADGNILAIFFETTPLMTSINPFRSKYPSELIPFCDILNGKVPLIRGRLTPQVHNSEVIQITYAPRLTSIISACKDQRTAIHIGDVHQKSKHCYYFQVHRGVLTFDYCNETNLLVTGGVDCVVRVWDAHEQRRPISMMHGHQSHVINVFICSAREIVISIGENKDVRVYGLNTLSCTQFIHHMHMPDIGRGAIGTAFYNTYRQSLVWATTVIFVLEENYKDITRKKLISHDETVCAAQYNALYGQVVSADSQSNVHIWKLDTGLREMRFNAASEEHGRNQLSGITTMSFDHSLRLLVTGACDGCVRVWNFSNGQCLRKFSRQSTQRVTSVHCLGHDVLAAGWNRQLTIYEFDVTKNGAEDIHDSCKTLAPPHADDILSMDFYPPDIIATSSYDGRIFVWALRTSHLMFLYHVRGLEPSNPFVSNLLQRQLQHIAASSSVDRKPAVKLSTLSKLKPPGKLRRERKQAEDAKVRKTAFGNLPKQVTFRAAATNIRPCKVIVNRLYTTQRDSVGNTNDKHGLRREPTFGTAVEKLLFLRTRPLDIKTATLLSSCADGVIRAWSARFEGGLIGEFFAAHRAEEPVVAMTTCDNDGFLVTGDTLGYMKLWDISHYAMSGRSCSHEEHKARASRWKPFRPFRLWLEALEHVNKLSDVFPFMSHANESDQPHLLLSFRAHTDGINSVDYFNNINGEFLISASMDCSVRLWTITGAFLGIFGQRYLWKYNCLTMEHIHNRYKSRGYVIPPDIRQAASTTTLKVFNQFSRCRWVKLCVFVACAVQFKAMLTVIKHRDFMKTCTRTKRRRSPFLKSQSDEELSEDYDDTLDEIQPDNDDDSRAVVQNKSALKVRDKASATDENKERAGSMENLTNIVHALGSYAVSRIKLMRSGADIDSISTSDKYAADDVIWKYYQTKMHYQEIPKVDVNTDILHCQAFTAMSCPPVEYTDYSDFRDLLAGMRERYDRIKTNHPSVHKIEHPARGTKLAKKLISLEAPHNAHAQTNA